MSTAQTVALIFVAAFAWIGLTLLVLLTLRRRRKGSSAVASSPPPPDLTSYRPHSPLRRVPSVLGQNRVPRRRLRLQRIRRPHQH